MSLPHRKRVLSPEDDKQLRASLRGCPTPARLVPLIRSQQKQTLAQNGDRGFFETAASGLEVAVRSMGLAKKLPPFLKQLVELYGMETVISFIELEEQHRHRLHQNFHVIWPAHEGPEKYYGQFDLARKALDVFGIDCKEAPIWDDIAARLTPNKLALIEKVEGAQLVLVPPKSRQDLVLAFNSKIGEYGLKSAVHIYQLDNDQLWNNGQPEKLEWTVLFVDGRQNLPFNKGTQTGKTAHEQVKDLRTLHEKDGVETLASSREYLSLMMQGIISKAPIDEKSWTVLNAEIVAKEPEATIGYGTWNNDRVYLNSAVAQSYLNDQLRLRATVRVYP